MVLLGGGARTYPSGVFNSRITQALLKIEHFLLCTGRIVGVDLTPIGPNRGLVDHRYHRLLRSALLDRGHHHLIALVIAFHTVEKSRIVSGRILIGPVRNFRVIFF